MKKLFRYLRQPFVSLLTVPAVIALVIGTLPFATIFLEHHLAKGQLSPYFVQFDVDSARTLLSVIATSAISALTLTYSLVLLVFTLAAGNISPRLLKRFSSELVNQVTAGLFGGTFIFSTTTLLFTEEDFVPKFTIAGAGALAVICVMQLIYFVRHVAVSVSIDDEMAKIAARLHEIVEQHQDREQFDDEIDESAFSIELKSPSSGYIGNVDTSEIVRIARQGDARCLINFSTGTFVLKDATLLYLDKETDEERREELLGAITVEPARGDNDSIEFSLNLLIEIAIRALSPGVNDTYTALAATDHISNVIGRISPDLSGHTCVRDETGSIRLITPGISVEHLMDLAFHPLRQAASDNLLMVEGLARSLYRLHVGGNEKTKELVAKHANLMKKQLKAGDHMADDVDRALELLP